MTAGFPEPLGLQHLALDGKKVLFVASVGGHLQQLVSLARSAHARTDSVLVTFQSPQSAQLDGDYNVKFVQYVKPRDYGGLLRIAPALANIMRKEKFDVAISTGSGVAIPALAIAATLGIRSLYVESFSRIEGPSTSGKILSHIPGVLTYTQHPSWASEKWPYIGNVTVGALPGETQKRNQRSASEPPRLLVTLGTIQPYRFDALIDKILTLVDPHVEVTWQLGCTQRTDLPGRVFDVMEPEHFLSVASSADLIISHAGIGNALTLSGLGRPMLLVPRRSSRNEHVDDHQQQLSREFSARGFASYREVENLCEADLYHLGTSNGSAS